MISELFNEKKRELAKQLLIHLNHQEITEEYQVELFKNFNSKINIIYDSKNDGGNLLLFKTKIFGKKNLVAFFSISKKNEQAKYITFIKGKIESIQNNYNFNDTETIIYGDYRSIDEENGFLF